MLMVILDGVISGSYYSGPSDAGYVYNTSCYANENVGPASGLPSGLHNLTIVSVGTLLFDYAVYT